MTDVLPLVTSFVTTDVSPNRSTDPQKRSLTSLPPFKLRQRQQEKVFNFINPLESLLNGLYKYKAETDRTVLYILADKLKKTYGEDAKFKDTASVLKYAWKIEDGEPISSLEIEKDDIQEPNKVSAEDLTELDKLSHNQSHEEMCEKNENRHRIGAANLAGIIKAPNLEYTCKVCMDHAVSVTFIPCGHLVVCGACAPALGDCPVCRQTVKGTISTKF